MKDADVKVGMKVIPVRKSVGMSFKSSSAIKSLQSGNKNFLVIDEINSLKDSDRITYTIQGDFFIAKDFEPYIENKTFFNNEMERKLREEVKAIYAEYYADQNSIIDEFGVLTDKKIIQSNKLYWRKIQIGDRCWFKSPAEDVIAVGEVRKIVKTETKEDIYWRISISLKNKIINGNEPISFTKEAINKTLFFDMSELIKVLEQENAANR